MFNSSIIEKNIIDINIKSYQAQLIYTTGNLFIEYIQKFKKNKNKKLNPDKIICEIIDLKKNTTIYGEAYNNNINFILNLHYKSFLYQYFIQFDSSAQINLKNEKEKSCLISLLTQNQIKFDLLKALNPFIIRIDFKTKYKACTFLDCPISIFNEKIIFKKKLKNEEIFLNSDRLYQKRTILSFLFKHERMTHVKKILNKSEIDFEKSPTIYYNFEKNKYFLLKTIEEQLPEIGDSFEFLISDGNIDLIENIFKSYNTDINLNKLYQTNIWTEETNDNLIKVLKEIQLSIKKYLNKNYAKDMVELLNEYPKGRYVFLRNNIMDYKQKK